MKSEEQRHSNSFVLRIWWEEDAQPIWRGWAQHATTGETRYFRRLSDLLAFVEAYTGPLTHGAEAVEAGREGNS